MAATHSPTYPQQETIRRRLPVVIVGLIFASMVLLGRLASFQFQIGMSQETVDYLNRLADINYTHTLRLAAARGNIYDRNGEALAVNTLEYQVEVNPPYVTDARALATRLSAILGLPELEVFEQIEQDVPWVQIGSPVSAEVGQRIAQMRDEMELGDAVVLNPLPRRSYPQGVLASQVIGFVSGDLQGYYGVEGEYQNQLAGVQRDREVSNIPFDARESNLEGDVGSDLVLTIDRDVQYLVQQELVAAISSTGAAQGCIIVMDPRNGDVLAMASYPEFDPNTYFNIEDPAVLRSICVSDNYEPGSVMKVVTMAAALDRASITPDFTYVDNGILEYGGVSVSNWNRGAWGAMNATGILVNSLNVGAATISTTMGNDLFYSELNEFGFGRRTGIDLQGEEAGILYVPGDPDWSEANLATNAFGQGMSVTALQMLTAVNAIANNGLMMQPRVVHQIVDGPNVITAQPAALGRPISAQTANTVAQMMVEVVRGGLDNAAGIPGFTVAGKTGTAEIPTPIGYEAGASITTFVGFLPADSAQISILIRLDRPREYWASAVVPPIFQHLAERLVILMSIPPDDVRHQLTAEGGSVGNIAR
jgi:cell division protein FtsI/penicillin-binding protein 2